MDFSSGPDLNYAHAYTSILRLGLATADTPDVPDNHLGIRGPSIMCQTLTYAAKIGSSSRGPVLRSRVFPEDGVISCRIPPEYVFPYLKNPGTIRLSLFE
ncbi:phosphoglucomutase, cytoplasmic [Dorcoceras hygrometricum]|uniref:Phosphoglucomutase, cytoplasmic n=1 Tax=Dorcoceras hygrometricum TaxID=472368 RepID=A0A2Z7AQC3_9LAMI|nr:phosphoglucomutase, cytoplasmic [Dorcoceras hygrometricum]